MNHFHVIKDPVHGTMQFTSAEDAWVKPFIDSPSFQRLRHIKQLGMGDFIFPGALHSRFNHSLGCCYVASQIAQKINLADEERQLVMIACLLHDIGHGPFSHAFEGIFPHKLLRHEAWTPYFLNEYHQDIFFENYNRLNPRHHLSPEKFSHIANMIMHKKTGKQVLADIVSSQLDADRLDYLLRDSHFCGVKYGEFDFRWLLHCLTIVKKDNEERLGITHKGIGAVEHYVMARRLMTRNIYHAQKKLALEEWLVQLFKALAQDLENPLFADIKKSRLGQFLIAANQLNAKPVTQDFLEQQFQYYKELCDYDIYFLIKQLAEMKDDHPAIHIAKRLQTRTMPKIVRLSTEDSSQIEKELQMFKASHPQFADWQLLLIKTPHQSYSGEEDPILVINEQEKIYPIGHYSFMINAIADKLEHVVFLCMDASIAEDKAIVKLTQNLLKN